MSKPSAASNPELDKRRSTRVVQALPIKVEGVDALREPFTERTNTVMVSCHGCKYQSRHYVPKGSIVTLEIPRQRRDAAPRVVLGSVIWVQRPNQAREILHIGLEFEVAGNVWDIAPPPEDWFPLPGEPEFAPEEPPVPVATPVAAPVGPVTLTASWDASEILVMASRAEGREAELATAMEKAKTAAADATAEGMKLIRQRLDAKLHDTIEEALKVSIERLSESVLEEARKTYQITAEQLDAKIQQAVEAAIKNIPVKRPNRGKGKR